MQYDAQTPTQYMDLLEDDWRREKLETLRTMIISQADGLEEGINYKMLSYSDDRGILFHLNAQKSYVSLYVGDTKKIDPTGEFLAGINMGKGCLRFKKSTTISETRIDEFIARALDLWEQGADVGC